MTRADRFTPCSTAPHCVSSQAPMDSDRHIAPFVFDDSAEEAQRALVAILKTTDNARVVTDEPGFIHATFRSRLGFVDDVTFLVQADRRVVDVKSESRLGYYDFGVNRRRVERLRDAFESRLALH